MKLPLLLVKLGFGLQFCRILLVPAQAQCVHRTASDVQESANADAAIRNLRQISKELNEAVNLFRKHLDDAIARYDQGYRTRDGKRVQGADADLAIGTADFIAAEREFMIARMMAASGAGYAPVALADSEHVQDLICEAWKRMDSSDGAIRQLLVVPVTDLNTTKQAEVKSKRDQLLGARSAAEEAAKTALASLPLDLPETDPDQEKKDRAWDFLVMGNPAPDDPDRPDKAVLLEASREARPKSVPLIPIRLARHKRITLVSAHAQRMALTDAAVEDREGRHIFYQERWIQRGESVLRMRWRVGVDTQTGQHVLIKRYPTREYHGEIDELYHAGLDYLWYLEPSDGSPEPSRQDLESAWRELANSREKVQSAAQEFRIAIRDALMGNAGTLDAGLPEETRETLFAVRGHLAGTAAILEQEDKVRHAVREAAGSIKKLEPLAAWANRVTPDQATSTILSASEWGSLQERSDHEIDLTQTVSREALAQLPPDISEFTAKFAALQKDVVVRMLRHRARNEPGSAVSFVQEIWRLEPRSAGSRGVRRIATLISIDSETGDQKVVGGSSKYYIASPEDSVEDVFGRYAAQDLPLQALRP